MRLRPDGYQDRKETREAAFSLHRQSRVSSNLAGSLMSEAFFTRKSINRPCTVPGTHSTITLVPFTVLPRVTPGYSHWQNGASIAGGQTLIQPKSTSVEDVDLQSLCVAIQAGCRASEEKLCNFLSPGLKLYLMRRTKNDYRDALNETLLRMLEAIRRGTMRNPNALPGYVRSVAMNYLAKHVFTSRAVSLNDEIEHQTGIMDRIQDYEKLLILENALSELDSIDRDILIRFYRLEEAMPKIAGDLRLGLKSAIMRKSRALAKLREGVLRSSKRAELRRIAKHAGTAELNFSFKKPRRFASAV